MKIYRNSIVEKYIAGDDIPGYTLYELENDPDFMKKVIHYSNDKKMYYFCSDEAKKNYELVKFVVTRFKDDVEFVNKVANEYISSINDMEDITVIELTLMMSEINKNKDTIEEVSYKLMAGFIYTDEDIASHVLIDSLGNKSLRETGNVFNYILNKYGNSKIITDFFATRLLNEIFYKEKINFEEFIHLNCKDKNMIRPEKIIGFIINVVERTDIYLADYLKKYPNLLDKLKKDIIMVSNNWENYNKKLEISRYDLLFNEISKYINEAGVFTKYSIDSYIYNSLKQVGKHNEYHTYLVNVAATLDFDVEIKDINVEMLTFKEKALIVYIEKIVMDIYRQEAIDEDKYDDYINAEKASAKVIKIPKKDGNE